MTTAEVSRIWRLSVAAVASLVIVVCLMAWVVSAVTS